jgi:hypothetical protein
MLLMMVMMPARQRLSRLTSLNLTLTQRLPARVFKPPLLRLPAAIHRGPKHP